MACGTDAHKVIEKIEKEVSPSYGSLSSPPALKPHVLVADYRGQKNFPEIARHAANLAKDGLAPDQILADVRQKFGHPEILRLRKKPAPVAYAGAMGVDFEYKVVEQMQKAMSIPVALRGAIMPDAHPAASALPVGGVALLDNAVSPKMVGPDISCSMHLTVLEGLSPEDARRGKEALLQSIRRVTHFGPGAAVFADGRNRGHAVLDDAAWEDLPHALKGVRDLAASQLGSSGSGNHFVDLVVFAEGDDKYVALVSHSGSRGAGAKIAKYYSELADKETRRKARGIPAHHSWLSLDSAAGQEYWRAMQLMGRYAEANHQVIHAAFLEETGLKPARTIYNRHNYAWRSDGGILHRKGATPAEKGVPGIIPGSCADPMYVVSGKGNADFLDSASHGAGRVGSRAQAKVEYDPELVNLAYEEAGVLVHGIAPDENPFAYKRIERVIEVQEESGLIDVVARGMPVVVVMGG